MPVDCLLLCSWSWLQHSQATFLMNLPFYKALQGNSQTTWAAGTADRASCLMERWPAPSKGRNWRNPVEFSVSQCSWPALDSTVLIQVSCCHTVCVEGRPREKWMTVRKKPCDKTQAHLLLQRSLSLPTLAAKVRPWLMTRCQRENAS